MIHFLIILKILHTIHATLFLIKLYFSKAVDVFYSTLRARITSKEDHQVLVDRVMNLGCKRIKLGGRRFVCKIEMIFSSKSCQDFAED